MEEIITSEPVDIHLDHTIYTARPTDKRLPKEERVYDLLERLDVSFERVDHDAVGTIEGCAEIEKLLDIEICKNLFLRNSKGDQYYLLMLPGGKHLVTKDLAKKIGSTRLSFGTPEKMEEYLDITPGSVSVLGLMNDHENNIQLLVDNDIKKWEYFGCHPCINTSSLKIKTADLFSKILPAVGHEPVFVDID
ncbi:MAG: prolyl-tRNA synthetase associated domain-containing protein [Clostridiales bacterium]|nr:prolyl-tRNA synthetase associated domain-containing protein [Clostridiales bacterium]MDY4434076.1 prolyl-tRNA synthetase associated domain-containing protein [Candidatus Flemingibacterium sp.]